MKIWTLEEVLRYYRQPTIHERKHNITTSAWKLIEDCKDILFYSNHKSDNSNTLLIVFKHHQGYYGLIPTKNQSLTLIEKLPSILNQIENFNKEHKIRKLSQPIESIFDDLGNMK